MDYKSSLMPKIASYRYNLILIPIIAITLIMLFAVINTNAKDQIYIIGDFCSGKNSFLPVSEFSVYSEIPAFFSGHLIYSNKKNSDYETYKLFDNVAIYESGSKKYGITNISLKQLDINKDHTILNFDNKVFSFFIMQDEGFVNPIPFINPRLSIVLFLNNVYYLNENDIIIRFRTKYKNNVIPVIINGYTRFYSGNASISSIPYQIILNVDGKTIYNFKLDIVTKKTIIELKTLYFKDNMLKYILTDLSEGKHDIEFIIIDINNNKKSMKKTIEIASDLKK